MPTVAMIMTMRFTATPPGASFWVPPFRMIKMLARPATGKRTKDQPHSLLVYVVAWIAMQFVGSARRFRVPHRIALTNTYDQALCT